MTFPATEDRPALPQLYRLSDLVDAAEEAASEAYNARQNGVSRGPATGLPGVDEELGGALPQGFVVLHGEPGVGKSAFLSQTAANCGFPALYVTCEMGPLELFRRHAARETETVLASLKSGELAPEAVRALMLKTASKLPALAIADATQAYADLAWIQETAESVRGASPHLLIAIDSVHSLAQGRPGGLTEYEALNETIARLQGMAVALACTVIGVAERNRASMAGGGISAAAASRKFEYRAEVVLALATDPTSVALLDEVPIKLTFNKNRNGQAGRAIDLRFHGAFQRFRQP